jgi:hypothetical protein
MKRSLKLAPGLISVFVVIILLGVGKISFSQQTNAANGTMQVGVARIDITPDGPIRLAGYGARSKEEAKDVIHRLSAKALALGSDAQRPSVLITADLVGVPWRITQKLTEQLSQKMGIDPAQLVICASHTHGGPEVGNLLNILQFRGDRMSDSLLALDQLIHIAEYTEQLSQKLEKVALEALQNRKPANVAWGQGQALFAANRRSQGGPVDVALPMLRITNPDGTPRAILVNYACHGTTFDGINKINGDWIAEAQNIIEAKHPGVTALVALGCAGDANPNKRSSLEAAKAHGQEVSDNVDKLLTAQLQPLTTPPVGKMKWIKLPFAKVPTVAGLIELTKGNLGNDYQARLELDRVLRGGSIPTGVNYLIQTWNFDNKMVMVNLPGEVVADYSVRLKDELGAEHLWINAYANDVPCYIASRRILKEGGYEGEFSMPWYNKPSPLSEEVEDLIVHTVHELMPPSFKTHRATTNHQQLIQQNGQGIYQLEASLAKAEGPNIKYMPEWKAFGWFNTNDLAQWELQVDKAGKYDVYLEWSVADRDAGKSFVIEAGNKKVKGRAGSTGSWYTYKTLKVGTIRLPQGTQKVTIKSDSPHEKGAIFDVRTLKLVPVK